MSGADVVVSHEWSGLFTSSDAGVQGTVGPAGGDLQLLVVDSQNRQGGYVKQITYDPSNQDSCI